MIISLTIAWVEPWMPLRSMVPTQLFNEIVVSTALQTELGTELIHVDTTNFSVYGDYDPDFNCSSISITKGFPKDGRWDLNRFVYAMRSPRTAR